MVALAVAMVADAQASRIVVNEVYRAGTMSSTTGDEWLELVLLEDLTAAELEGFYYGDSTSSTASKFSGYHLRNLSDISPMFYAGTVLVVAGGAGPAADHAYDPASNDWVLVFRTSDAEVVSNGSTADLAATDVAYVDTDGTNGVSTLSADGHAVNWDPFPYGAFGANASVTTVANPGNPGSMWNSNGVTTPNGTLAWTATAASTPGAGNNAANTSSIQALRDLWCLDSDYDGACDVSDVCPYDAPPEDDDADGACDSDDLCQGADDALDADLDGTPDGCDGCPLDAPPDDDDGDLVCDADDVCAFGSDSSDADSDGVPDACDACPSDAEPGDTDADGVCDSVDRCEGAPDGDDADADGVPNLCDFGLSVSGTASPGQQLTLRGLHSVPGEVVMFYVSPGPAGVGPCPANFGGRCYSLGPPVQNIGNAPTNGAGIAPLVWTVPNLPPGAVVTFQAGVRRGVNGADSDTSNWIETTIQ